MKRARIIILITKINISKPITDHLIGEKHSLEHRRTVGVCIMITGVMLVKLTAMIQITIIHFLGDVIGYFIHAVGAIPLLQGLETHEKEEKEKNEAAEKQPSIPQKQDVT